MSVLVVQLPLLLYLSRKPAPQPFEVDVLVLSVLPLCLLYAIKLNMNSAFFIPFGQVVSEAIGAGVQDMKNGWRLLCKYPLSM